MIDDQPMFAGNSNSCLGTFLRRLSIPTELMKNGTKDERLDQPVMGLRQLTGYNQPLSHFFHRTIRFAHVPHRPGCKTPDGDTRILSVWCLISKVALMFVQRQSFLKVRHRLRKLSLMHEVDPHGP